MKRCVVELDDRDWLLTIRDADGLSIIVVNLNPVSFESMAQLRRTFVEER